MLKQRVVTALVLLPMILGPIFWFPTPWLFAFLSAVGLIAAWEWTALMGLTRLAARLAYLALVALMLALAGFVEAHFALGYAVLMFGAIWWGLAASLIAGYPVNFRYQPWGLFKFASAGLLMIVPAVLGLSMLHASHNGIERLFFLFALVWMADIGAYFAGRRFGRRKLAPDVSPGKTIEGAFGGFAASMAMVAAAPWVFGFGRFDWLPLILLCAVVFAASVIGDLTESLFKRHRGVKDSGTLLPGHGGVLDRIDSLLAAAPVLAFGLVLIGT